ncbi:MAG: hypothetical protein H0T78_05855 [Longispora sp.]|nr:hypothetical protein [Longispora sp. (in: high G+C Gram-positive bacteria)]
MEFFIATRPVLAALFLGAFLYKLPSIRSKRRDRAVVALLACFASEAIGWTLTIPAVCGPVDQWVGIAKFSTLLMQLLGAAIFGPSLMIVVIHWTTKAQEKARYKTRLTAIYGAVTGLSMIALWLAVGDTQLLLDKEQLLAIIYLVLYQLSFGAGLIVILWSCWAYSYKATDKWLRRGLRVTALGSLCYFTVSIIQILTVMTRLLEFDSTRLYIPMGIGGRLGTLGIVGGLLLPSVSTHVSAVSSWLRNCRSYRHLFYLWHDLNQAIPGISLLGNAPLGANLRSSEVSFMLQRRVVEIRDAWRELRPYMPEQVPSWAVTQNEREIAHAAALALHTAILVKSSGGQAKSESTASELERLGIGGLDEDITWLVAVGRAYSAVRRSKATSLSLTS